MTATPNLAGVANEVCRQRGYKYLGELGKGAFKSAYLIDSDGGHAALKLAIINGSSERLVREATALQACSHQSIARLCDVFSFQSGASSFLVVIEEYLSGGTLEAKLRQGVLPANRVRRIGLSLAEVLKHLHERRLVHRDIKPANILFRENPEVPVLTDFGVVRALDQPSLTRTFLGMGPGTPAYAAPEQLNNEKHQIGWRTDQFGLGVVLAECLLGRHPFLPPGATVHNAIAAVAAKQPPPQSSIDELSGLGFSCLSQALQPWPVLRYRKPDDFIKALLE